jgi:hypothetical protein
LSTASISCILRQIKAENPTATACTYEVVRFTGGTAGGDITEAKYRPNGPASSGLLKGLWTADATIVEKTGDIVYLPAGAAEIMTFGENGLETALGSTAGIGLVPIGTGQLIIAQFTWDE